MARANLLGLAGLIVSLCCFAVIVLATVVNRGFGAPSISYVDLDIYGATLVAATFYILGTLITCFHQIGGVFQIPPIGVLSLLAWYAGSWIQGVFWMALPILGTVMILLSWFEGAHMPGSRAFAPSESEEHDERRILSMKAKKAVGAIAVASLASVATIFGVVFTQPVASLEIEVMIDGVKYGAVDLTISVDGNTVVSEYLEPRPEPYRTVYFMTTLDVSGGMHKVVVDVTSETYQATNGVVDAHREVKVLPFTKQTELFPIGVALI